MVPVGLTRYPITVIGSTMRVYPTSLRLVAHRPWIAAPSAIASARDNQAIVWAGVFSAVGDIGMEKPAGHEAEDGRERRPIVPGGNGDQGDRARQLPRKKTILVVDDEPGVAAVLMEIFRLDGYAVQLAEDGEVALAKLQQRTYDAIVSDVRMPKVDGSALYRAVAQWNPQLLKRFIFLTGDTATPGVLEFIERTGLPFVTKPFPVDVLRQVVRHVINGNERADRGRY
jgi:CheY-like chemotaxis protein